MKTLNTIKSAIITASLLMASLSFAGEPVDVNKADADTIAKSLDGVGITKAKAIVAYRAENGNFVSVDDFDKVKGIGAKTLEKNKGNLIGLTGN